MNPFKRIITWYKLKFINKLYTKEDYLEAYRRHTDLRIDWNYKTAIGGNWDEIGMLQYEFLIKNGLEKKHSLLDVGMGTLRAGRFFIEYLDEGNYTGFDISQKAVEFSKKFIVSLKLEDKKPTILYNQQKSLDFSFLDKQFDFILAHSVFTHLNESHIREIFKNLYRVMNRSSRFYFTIFQSNKPEVKYNKDFYFPFEFFRTLSEDYGYILIDCSNQYDHPKGQRMLLVTPKN